jgi:DNA-binding NarL/FixJ family response regulator
MKKSSSNRSNRAQPDAVNLIRVLLADDHALVRSGIRSLLDKMPNLEVVGEASNGREALALVKTELPNLVLMDIAMPELNGLDTLVKLVKNFPGVKVVVLSAHANEEYVIRALRSGASGYMLKDSATAELQRAIGLVTQDKIYLSPSLSQTVIDSYFRRGDEVASLEQPTARQREVLQLLAEGKNTKEIAAILEISVKTVETHRLQLMSRLSIHDVPGLVRYAIRKGLVSSET